MSFDFYRFRFHFQAKGSVFFPPGKSGNVIRGAFGEIFRRLVCVPDCPGALRCEIRSTCPYARIFEPRAAHGEGPSGLADWPRPFVFRASHLDGCLVKPGEPFHFDVHLFDLQTSPLPYFVLTFAQLAREGLGPRRGRAALTAVEQLALDGGPAARVFEGAKFLMAELAAPCSIDLTPGEEAVNRVRIRFLTPTELKSGRQNTAQAEFPVLFSRIRDRVSTLRALYGPGPLEVDFRALGERAAEVHMTRSTLELVEVDRRSSRSGQVHPLGGFIGDVEYEGPLAEFLPYLHAARFTGVGRQTVWGKGEIEVIPG